MSVALQTAFLVAVLGKDGAAALNKAVTRRSDLADVLVPRTVLSFVNTVQALGYKGAIPGVPGSMIALTKSGGVINSTSFSGSDANAFTMSAHLAVMLGLVADTRFAKNTRNVDLTRFGKAIDVLVKSRLLRGAEKLEKKPDLDKTDLPGTAAKPMLTPPTAATPPGKQPAKANAVASTKKQKPVVAGPRTKDKVPGLKAVPTVKIPGQIQIKKSEAAINRCKVCGRSQVQNGHLTGCFCLTALLKSATVTTKDDSYLIAFGSGWDEDSIEVLFESLHGIE